MNNFLHKIGLDGEELTICGLDGKAVVADVVRGEMAIYPLAKGIYVVRAGMHTAKVNVR